MKNNIIKTYIFNDSFEYLVKLMVELREVIMTVVVKQMGIYIEDFCELWNTI